MRGTKVLVPTEVEIVEESGETDRIGDMEQETWHNRSPFFPSQFFTGRKCGMIKLR